MERFVDDFAHPEFIEMNRSFFDKYVDLRVRGYHAADAFTQTFGVEHYGEPQAGYRRTKDIEASEYYIEQFALKLKEAKSDDLWNAKTSIHELLTIVRGVYVKDSVKLNAIKELNVLCSITIIDENGKTKAGRSLADFYTNEGIHPAGIEDESQATAGKAH